MYKRAERALPLYGRPEGFSSVAEQRPSLKQRVLTVNVISFNPRLRQVPLANWVDYNEMRTMKVIFSVFSHRSQYTCGRGEVQDY